MAVGSRLLLLSRGHLVARGLPLDILAAHAWRQRAIEELRDLFRGRGVSHTSEGNGHAAGTGRRSIPHRTLSTGAVGARLSVAIRAEVILLERGTVAGLSASNVIPGRVTRILPHAREAEVMVRTGGVDWIASVVEPAVAALELGPGLEVNLVIKARS